jgi:hypothetical protein
VDQRARSWLLGATGPVLGSAQVRRVVLHGLHAAGG